MKHLACLVAAGLLAAPAFAQKSENFSIEVSDGQLAGQRVAISRDNKNTAFIDGKIVAWQGGKNFWLEARQSETGETSVKIVGQILHFQYAADTPQDTRHDYGANDLKEPGWIGYPAKAAPVRVRWTSIWCDEKGRDAGYLCRRVDEYEIPLEHEWVRKFVAANGEGDIRVSLRKNKKTDWRIDTAELTATLEALGALEQFQ